MNIGDRTAAAKLIWAILKRDLNITVFDGEEITLRKSTDFDAIFKALDTTGEDELIVRDKSGKRVGTFALVYCNAEDGSELIADYTANELCEEIYNKVTA